MHKLLPIAAILVALAPSLAAAQTDPRVGRASRLGEIVVSTAAQARIATQLCKVGRADDIDRIIMAMDKRYRYCASKDPAWTALLGKFAADEQRAKAADDGRSLGSFHYDALLKERTPDAEAAGAHKYCTDLPWKMMLEPAAATDSAKAEYKRSHPEAKLEDGLAFLHWLIGLGRDQTWTEAPCDTAFWPEYPGPKK
ncbi:MAG: hypothetical protein KIT25_15940 [Enhydrobacter sp.]|nr:MAG: hypothetical protein KIT25_15940 [Enhydrobacter sp.]